MYRNERYSLTPCFKIIKVLLTDLDMICFLEESIFSAEDRFSRRQLRYLLLSPRVIFLLCKCDQNPVGYGIALFNRLRNGRRKGRIYSIGILDRFRHQGAGSLLLPALEGWLVEKGVSFITLETKKGSGGAGAFFHKHGYVITQILPRYYGASHGIRMKKNVTAMGSNKMG